MRIEKQYFLANLLFLMAFLGVILFLLLFREHLVCPYKANGLTCPGCGLSRTILTFLGQKRSFQPSTSLILLATFFLGQTILRTGLLVAARSSVRFSQKWIIADVFVSVCWFVSVMIPFY